ncbi:MAG: competence/damage-inducible protein A [Crocinitomicaceae bacterium]|nr:competence/damage-inducible protein A [Crocinitomicaceae bacterium]
MQAEIITIGDELLIGQTIDTNSTWMGEQLNSIGIRVHRATSIADDRKEILNILHEALLRSELILVTGGLGPTKDDITKKTLCEFFETDLIMHQPSVERITALFKDKGLPILEMNLLQAEVPRSCKVLNNSRGTASGMWFEKNGKVLVFMPGVPYEMMGIMEEEVLPEVQSFFKRPEIVHHTILTQGVGETFLAEQIKDWEDSLSSEELKLAYLPSPGMVKLRLSAYGGGEKNALEEKIFRKKKELEGLIGEHIFGYDKETLASVVGKLLLERNATLCVAESCTGGFVSHLITCTPGSSDYFVGGVIAYTNSIKDHQLGVSSALLDSEGAVNDETARQMAAGARDRLNTSYAISTTGIAGPSGGTKENPVGTVWIGISGPNRTFAYRFQFGRNRERNILIASHTALNLLRKEIIGQNV